MLVVDNGSTDGTLDIVRRLPVRLEVIPGGFVSRSRNVGARAAAHPLLAFIDSDCVVRSGWGQAVRAVLADESIGVTGSRHVLRDHATWVERAWDRAHRRRSPAALVPTAYIPAGNLATRRDVFLAVDGFDESLETGEDPDLCARIAARGHRVVEARDVQCVHLGEPRTLGDVFRRERWHGRGARLRYGDGRLAPIMISSTLFAVCLAGAVAGVLLAPMIGSAWPLVLLAAPLAVPMIYAARYARGDVRARTAAAGHLCRLFRRPNRGAAGGGVPRVATRPDAGGVMIEVLHVIDTYRIGGPGKTIINSARWIDPAGWHLHVAAFTHPETSRNEFARAVRAAGIPFLELRETRRVNVDHVAQLRRYVRDAGIRIVHTHGYRSDLLGYVATRGIRRPVLVTTHHGWIRNNPRQDLMTRLVLRLCQRFDGVEVVSDMLRRELPRALQQSPRTAVVHNAVVVEDYAASGARARVRAELGLGPGDSLLGVFGRISIEKGCLEMIEALAQLVAMRPNVRLAFIGEGPLVAEVRARVDAAGLAGRVLFLGHREPIRPVLRGHRRARLPVENGGHLQRHPRSVGERHRRGGHGRGRHA